MFDEVVIPDYELTEFDNTRRVFKALLKLPARYERVIRMRFFQEKTLVEVAETFELTQGRVWQMEAKALRMLKNKMKNA